MTEDPTRVDATRALGTPPGIVIGAAQVGRYELLLALASGGMATVYLGRQRGAGGFERVVAVKRMHPHVGAVPELAAAFLDEARIASLIHHPNVVRVHDVHDDGGERLLVMDYVDGVSLAQLERATRRAGERIPMGLAVRIAIEALRGLHAAHELQTLDGRALSVVHRDATPQNILIGIDGEVKLTDFGVARAAERSTETATGQVKGKLRYMSPEQARGGEIDRRVDIFALGVVLWEMLASRRFLDGDTDLDVLRKLALADFPKLLDAAPSIDPVLAAMVDRAVAAEPADRWASAALMADALESWARAHGHSATAAELAQGVDRLCGASLRERRAQLVDILSGARMPVIPGAAANSPPDTGSVSRQAGARSVPAEATPRRASRAPLVVLSALVVALAATAALALLLRAAPVAPVAPATSAPVAAPSASAIPRVTVTITSTRPITSLRAPSLADLALRPDGATFTLPRGDEPVVIHVALDDGTETDELIRPTANVALMVRTAPPAASATARTKPGSPRAAPTPTPAPTTPRDAPTLRKNPYE